MTAPTDRTASRLEHTANASSKRWSSPGIFVLAAGCAAIGFNNFWQFPQLVTTYGGGAFLIVYFLFLLLIGAPLLMAEFALGRGGRSSPVGAFRRLALRMRADPNWSLVGWMGVVSAFLIFSYLNVIAGWTMAYTLRSTFGVFSGLTVDGMNGLFSALVKDPEKQLFWHTLFLVVTLMVVRRGVRRGIETATRIAASVMIVLLLLLLACAALTGFLPQALHDLLMPDFTKLSGMGVLAAMSHAFFSLGLGGGAMLMYGAYLDDKAPIARLSWMVVGIDTLVGIVACLIIFSVLLAGGVNLSSGPTLVFQSLPLAFDHVHLGRLFAPLFFLLLVVVAWTSAIALAEPVVVWLVERFAISRLQAVIRCGFVAWVLGVVTIFSFSGWAFSFRVFGVVKNLGFFDLTQVLTAQVLLPLCGILVAVFAGWVLKLETTRAALALRSPCAYDAWLWLMRVVIPLLLVIVLFNLPELFA